ncbi:MAG: hypothetical protein QG652_72 [Pseudomonadota bacterium]|nr:hypothetical protein [Pseudomonadota bacterium]
MRFAPYFSTILLIGTTSLTHATPAEFEITIRDHRFTPATVTVPAGVRIKLKIINTDATAEEFESRRLNREKVIPGNSSTAVLVGPLQAGEYDFFGEFNQATAQGKIIAK